MELDPEVEAVLQRDAHELIKRFSARGSLSFKDFQQEWLESQFYYIHCIADREDVVKNAITEAVFSAMTDIALDSGKPMNERVGAVFVWYAMHLTQLSTIPTSIRLSMADWAGVQALHRQLKQEGCAHADYILSKLKSSSAFHMCYSRKRFSPGMHKEEAAREALGTVEQHLVKEDSSLVQSIRGVSQLQHQYADLKASLSEHLPPHLIVHPSLSEFVTQERLSKITREEPQSQPEEEATQPDETSDEATPRQRTTGKRRRRMLKNKAYTSAPSSSRRKQRQTSDKD